MSKGQEGSLVGTVIGGVMALIIGVIVIYSVGFPVLTQTNSSFVSAVNVSLGNNTLAGDQRYQQTNWSTIFTLLGVMAIITTLAVFMLIARLAG